MNKIFYKKISRLLAFTVVITALFAGILLVPAATNAQVTDQQAFINSLLQQLQQLQAQIQALQSGQGQTTVILPSTFTRDLTIGSTGTDVRALQQFLNANGATVAATGAGSVGNETQYFGQLTRAAVARWQSLRGITPAVGYFGPITRSAVQSVLATTPIPTPTPTPTSTIPTTGAPTLNVSLAAENPLAGSLISSPNAAAARVPILTFNATAGGTNVTITQMRFRKTGVVSDNAISNAYLIDNNRVVAQYSSITGGVISFNNLSLALANGETRKLTLAIDPAQGLTAGNTLGFSLSPSADITAQGATGAAVTINAPTTINSNTFTITSVSNPSLASLAITSSPVPSAITAGSTNNLVGSWNFSLSNNSAYLRALNLTVIGSANRSDVRNIRLVVNGVQRGQILPSLGTDGKAFFDLSTATSTTQTTSGVLLNTGSNTVQAFADVTGSPSLTLQFSISNAYDVLAVDSQYNVPISAQSSTGTQITISQGAVVVSTASDTPTGSVSKGQSNVTLAKFTVYAAGEPLRIKNLGFNISFTGVATGTALSSLVRNISLIDDAGGQIGNTISSPPSGNTCDTAISGTTGAGFTLSTGTSVYADCFGSSSNPINYTIPANTTRTLSLRGDIQSTAVFNTLVASLTGNTNNLQGVTSNQTSSSGPASGGSLSLISTPLTVSQSSGLGTQTYAPGMTDAKIGSYVMTAASAEDISINNVTIQLGAGGNQFSNLKLMRGTSQIGQTQGVLTSSGTYSFSGTFTITRGTSATVDVFANILSSATGTIPTATTLTSCSGTGTLTFSTITCPTVPGQSITIAGQSALQVSISSGTSPVNQITMGSSNNPLAAFTFINTTNVEDIKITDINIFDTVSGTATTTQAGFTSLTLSGATSTVTPVTTNTATSSIATSTPGPGFIYSFHFTSPIIVPRSGSVTLSLRGDVASFNSGAVTDNSTHTFRIATSTDPAFDTPQEAVVALGSTSNSPVTVNIVSAVGNTVTILRSKLTLTATQLGTATGRVKSSVDDLATMNFTADIAGDIMLNTVTITFSGTAPNGASFFSTTAPITLYDPSTGTSFTPTATNGTNTLTFNLSNYLLSAGTTKSFTLRLNSLPPTTAAGTSGVSQSLGASITAAADVTYTDAISGGTTVSLPTNAVPINISSVTYAQGT